MGRRISVLALTVTTVFACARLWSAEDASMGKDLGATIALQGMPCDKVVETKRNADSDYNASCKDGNRYHVYVNAQGRVIVQKL